MARRNLSIKSKDRLRLNHRSTTQLLNLCFDFQKSKQRDRKSTRLNSSHLGISYAVFCLKKKKNKKSKNIILKNNKQELKLNLNLKTNYNNSVLIRVVNSTSTH